MNRTIISLSGFLAGFLAGLLAGLLLAPLAANAAPQPAPQPNPARVCAPGELPQDLDAEATEVAAHRHFDLPVVVHPFRPKLREPMQGDLVFDLLIDETGHVACYGRPKSARAATPAEQAVIDGIGAWTYTPFTDAKGTPIKAYITESVPEEEAYEKIVPLPDGPVDGFSVRLERTGCFGSCPDYAVSLKGDGAVSFQATAYSDVVGKHSWRIDPAAVSALIDTARQTNIWSARDAYSAAVTDLPAYTLRVTIGGQTKTIRDYGGAMVGMPSAVSRFMDAVDTTAGTGDYIHLTPEGVARLYGQDFDFSSQAGADLLADANADADTAENAVLMLIQAGAPLHGGHAQLRYGKRDPDETALLPDAIRLNRTGVVKTLLDAGALKDQKSIDAAFGEAIGAGHMAMVQTIWAYHPSLTYTDTWMGEAKVAPMTLQLGGDYGHSGDWDGLAIAQFLLAQGCDINAQSANGKTLLHIAANAGDAAFVRYLLDHGAKVDTLDNGGNAPLDDAEGADVEMMLLDAGADPTHKPDSGYSAAENARLDDDKVILDWLRAHGKMAPLQNPKGGF